MEKEASRDFLPIHRGAREILAGLADICVQRETTKIVNVTTSARRISQNRCYKPRRWRDINTRPRFEESLVKRTRQKFRRNKKYRDGSETDGRKISPGVLLVISAIAARKASPYVIVR